MQLLEKNPEQRLGFKDDATEIKAHPWFEKVNWAALTSKSIKAPFVPILTSDADNSNFDEEFTTCSINSYSENQSDISGEGMDFAGFAF